MAPSVFLAYAREDEAAVRRLHKRLTAAGFSPWMDRVELLGGAKWEPRIRTAIQSADFFVACLSKSTASNEGFYQSELKKAYETLKRLSAASAYLIPVRLEQCDVPPELSSRHWIDLFASDGPSRLVDTISAEWTLRQTAPPARTTTGRKRKVERNGRSSGRADDSVTHTEFASAIKNNELVLHFQPKTRLNSDCVIGVESLVRWQHPTRGLLMPSTFMHLFEHPDVAEPLTKWVLNDALDTCELWRRVGINLSVGVNVSARSLTSNGLGITVDRALKRVHGDPRWLQLEITETAMIENLENARHVVDELRALGVSIAVDDFGTRHSSLNRINEIRMDELKLDKPFVDNLEKDPTKLSVIRAIVNLSHELDIKVVAEGVESQGTMGLLSSVACDAMQGWFVSKALPPQDLVRWLIASRWKVQDHNSARYRQ